jgi:hypothetical protein
VLEKLGLAEELHLDILNKTVCQQKPILLLSDIGGSILYRCGERLIFENPINKRNPDFQIRQHYHYFRPYFDDFLKAIIEHPRAKFAIYTSIQRKNAMPLLYKVFEN